MRFIRRIIVPKHFDIAHSKINNLIRFYGKLLRVHHRKVLLDVASVEHVSDDAFVVLKAQIEKTNQTKRKKTLFIINRPKDKRILYTIKKQFGYSSNNNRIEIHIDKDIKDIKDTTINTEIIDKTVKKLKTININEYFEPFYDFLVELIGNATEHGIKDRHISWWLIHDKDINITHGQCMRYIFVDMGCGIAASHRRAGLPFKYLFRRDSKIVKDSMDGVLKSSTGQPNRGRGLPYIKSIVEKGFISDFFLVTNRTSVKLDNGKLIYSHNKNFIGTYFTWTINKDNVLAWKSLK